MQYKCNQTAAREVREYQRDLKGTRVHKCWPFAPCHKFSHISPPKKCMTFFAVAIHFHIYHKKLKMIIFFSHLMFSGETVFQIGLLPYSRLAPRVKDKAITDHRRGPGIRRHCPSKLIPHDDVPEYKISLNVKLIINNPNQLANSISPQNRFH